MRAWAWGAGAACSLVLAGMALAAPARAPVPPPYSGAYQPVGKDEIGLWREDDESERALAASSLVVRDEALTAYVRGVLCNAVGADRCKATRVYVVRVPIFNASMSPNGTMRVYSGLLLRTRNEAELAAVLGHEFGHFERRHTLSGFKAARSSTDMLSWAQVLTGIAGTYQAQIVYGNLQMSALGNLSRFGRDQEREADVLGIGYLNGGSLRPQAAATVWTNLMAETSASASARGLSKPQFDKVAFLASHPPEAERATYLTALASPEAAAREDGADRYAKAMAPWLPTFLDDQVKLNDFGATEYVIQALAKDGWTATLWSSRGDLYRMRGNPRDLVHAAEFYGNAVGLDPNMADAHRGLGLSLIKTGRRSEGEVALRRYLELKPKAADAAMIGMLMPATGASK